MYYTTNVLANIAGDKSFRCNTTDFIQISLKIERTAILLGKLSRF